MYIATSLLFCTTFIFQTTFCSDNHKEPLLDPNSYEYAERQIRYSVLAEPYATHTNPRAWREGIDLHTIAAIPYVSKAWNSVCKEIVGKPRNEIIETCKKKMSPDIILSPSSIIFNQYGDMFCIKTNQNISILATNGRFYALKTFIYDVTEKFKTDYTKNLKNYNVSSCAVSYTNEYGQSIKDAVFITQILEYPDLWALIFPTLKNEYEFIFWVERQDSRRITDIVSKLQETLPKITKKMCAAFHEKDSKDNDFWSATFNKHGICKNYNSRFIDIYITDDYFNDVRQSWDYLTATPDYYNTISCSCGSENICPDCNERYMKVCAVLEYEHALHLKPHFLKPFARKHILYKITEHNGETIYANPLGRGPLRKNTKQEITQLVPIQESEKLCYDLDTLKIAAQTNASEWHTAEKPLLSYRYSNVTMPLPSAQRAVFFDLFLLEQEKIKRKLHRVNIDDLKNITIERSIALQYNGVPIIIAKLRADGSDDPILYFYNTQYCKENLRQSHSDTKYDLEKIFKTVLSRADQGHSCAIKAPNDVVNTFVAYVEKLQPALTAIPEEINHYKLIDLESSHLYCHAEDFAEKLNIVAFGSNRFCFHKQNNRLQCVYFDRQNASISNRDFAITVEPDEAIIHTNEYNPFSYFGPYYYIFLLHNLCNQEKRIIFWKDLQFRKNQQENPDLKHITLEPNTMPTYSCGSSEELEKIFAVFSNTWNKPFECVIQITNENALTFIQKIKTDFKASGLAREQNRLNLTDKDIASLKIGYVPPVIPTVIPATTQQAATTTHASQNSNSDQTMLVSHTSTIWSWPQVAVSAWYLIKKMPFLFKKF